MTLNSQRRAVRIKQLTSDHMWWLRDHRESFGSGNQRWSCMYWLFTDSDSQLAGRLDINTWLRSIEDTVFPAVYNIGHKQRRAISLGKKVFDVENWQSQHRDKFPEARGLCMYPPFDTASNQLLSDRLSTLWETTSIESAVLSTFLYIEHGGTYDIGRED